MKTINRDEGHWDDGQLRKRWFAVLRVRFDNYMMNSGSPVANPNQGREIRQFRTTSDLQKFLYSEELCLIMQKLLKYDYQLVISVSASQLREASQKEMRRLQALKLKEKIPRNLYLDNELAATVMYHQVRALAELIKINEENLRKLASPAKKKQPGEGEDTHEGIVARRYQGIQAQIQKNDGEVKAFMEAEVLNRDPVDLQACHSFFRRQSRRLRRSSNEKLILSRAHLLDALSYCLAQALRLLYPDSNSSDIDAEEEDPSSDSNDVNEQPADQLSYEQINRWKRLASRALEQKLTELAGVCEQIPQLQAFNRTMQFSQLQNRQRVVFLRVVDVLISLHHRVSYLSRNKPQLLRELQHAQEELAGLNSGCEAFLQQLEQETAEIAPIHFAAEVKKHSQLSEPFLQLRRHLIKMGEVIVSQDQFHTQSFDRADRLLQLVRLYVRAVGQEGQEWEQLVASLGGEGEQAVSEEEYQLVMQLQECLLEYQNKLVFIQQLEQQSTTKTNEELEQEVNKLISDYERLKQENKQHLDSLDMLTRLRDELQMEIEERDNMIYNLSGLKVALEKRLANNEGNSSQSNRVLQEELKKQERETQKYLQSSLLLREQLKVSENEREKLLLLAESEKEKYMKVFEGSSRFKADKERLQLENEQLLEKIEKMKNDSLRQTSKLNKQINDITNERDLLQQELKTAQANNAKLMDRLQANERRIADYSKLVVTRFEDRDRQPKNERDQRAQAEVSRLEAQLERCKRELERSRKELEGRRVEMDIIERESANYQLEISSLKTKLKETRLSQEDAQEKDQLVRELRSKLDKSTARANALLKQIAEVREEEQQASSRNRSLSKRLKELQTALAETEAQNVRLNQELQQKHSQNGELQKNITSQTTQFNMEIKHLREMGSRQEDQLRDKNGKLQAFERKIERLQAELAAKRSQGEESARELVEMKVRQYQSTIQTHKLIQVKLEEQARTLKTQLEQKVQVEIKLNLEIDRLSKEIDRMKQQLERFLRELTEKQLIIKKERENYEEQVKIIRQYEVKERIQQQGLTPIRPYSQHKRREEDTPSHIDDHKRNDFPSDPSSLDRDRDSILSKSNIKYDIYFNAKEYDRLQKEYNDFRNTISQKVEQLERSLQQARKTKVDLQIKYNNLAIENKRIITSRTINNSNNSNNSSNGNNGSNSNSSNNSNNNAEVEELRKKIESLQAKLQQSSSMLVQYTSKISEMQITITNLQKTNQGLVNENSQNRKDKSELDAVIKQRAALQDQLVKAKATISNLTFSTSNASQIDKLKQTIQLLNEQITKLEREKNKNDTDSSQTAREMTQLVKERDDLYRDSELLRRKIEQLRRQLEEGVKRTFFLETQLAKIKEELRSKQNITIEGDKSSKKNEILQRQLQILRNELKIQRERKTDRQDINVQYYLQKIRSLQDALLAVGDELNDCKQCLYREYSKDKGQALAFTSSKEYQLMLEDNQRLFGDNQYLAHANQQLAGQLEHLEAEWKAKERLYLQELQALSRQNVSLKDLMSKPSEKQITTNLPPKINLINTNYHQPHGEDLRRERSRDFDEVIRQMDGIIEGRTRWEGGRLIESLQRWRVPIIVCKEIEDLLAYLSQVVELIKFLKVDYASLRNLSPDNILFENLLEFVFRVLVYFSQINTSSAQAGKIKAQLAETAKKYSGGLFFTVLEEYTIHILENNAIEEYKRELRTKAKELLEIKEKLDELITRQIEQEERMVNRPQSHRSRDTTPYKESLNASPKPVK